MHTAIKNPNGFYLIKSDSDASKAAPSCAKTPAPPGGRIISGTNDVRNAAYNHGKEMSVAFAEKWLELKRSRRVIDFTSGTQMLGDMVYRGERRLSIPIVARMGSPGAIDSFHQLVSEGLMRDIPGMLYEHISQIYESCAELGKILPINEADGMAGALTNDVKSMMDAASQKVLSIIKDSKGHTGLMSAKAELQYRLRRMPEEMYSSLMRLTGQTP